MKRKIALILACLMLLAAFTACGTKGTLENQSPSDTETNGDVKSRDEFIFGVYNFTKIDPANSYNGWGTLRYGVGETLYKLDDSLNVEPVLTESHELSEDTLTWTLKLREDVLFHNGDKMDGAAVKASLERLVEKNQRAASDLMIDKIEAEGFSVFITTTAPNPILLNALCDPYACIVDAKADDGTVDFDMYPVCTGPYFVKDYVEDQSAALEAFEDYWGGPPASSSISIKAISDVDTLGMAMQNGEIDAAYGLSYNSLDLFANNEAFEISQAATTRVYMLYFNLGREYMSDPAFRRAICMAVDKSSYGEILLSGAGTATKSAFPAALSYGDDSLMSDVPDYDPEAAAALLEENGYKDTDGDGFLEKDGKKLSLRLITYGRTGLPQSAQALQSALSTLGIETSYDQVDSIETYLDAGDFDICAYAYVTTPTGDPLSYLSFTMGTGNGSNFGGYSNDEVDRLLTEMASEFDPAKRAEYAIEIQQIATKDSSYCYMFHLNMFMVTKAGVKGISQSPVDYYQITVDTARN